MEKRKDLVENAKLKKGSKQIVGYDEIKKRTKRPWRNA